MSIQIQGSANLVKKFYIAMANGFMQRNGVPQTKIDQITKQFEILNTPPTVMPIKSQSQPAIQPNRYGISTLLEKEYGNCAT